MWDCASEGAGKHRVMLGIEESGIIVNFLLLIRIKEILNNSMHSAPGAMLLHR